MAEPIYDTIGAAYRSYRRPDARIAARIERALGGAPSVVNVGAGTGSYEPTDRPVVAVEPSGVMLAGRPPGSAPAVRAVAGALPFGDGSFGAATALITMHHWPDWRAGVAELRRVADRVVVLTFDAGVHLDFWLIREYFPAVAELPSSKTPPCDEVARALGGAAIEVVEVPADCDDGFMWAYWNRPERYLDPVVQSCTSGLSLISATARRTGTDRLAADLRSGRWLERHGHLLDEDAVDGGFRLIVGPGTDVAPMR